MPYVFPGEAPNLSHIDYEAVLSDTGGPPWRRPLVGTPALRVVLLRLGHGEEPHPPHQHPHADEVMVVLQGQGVFRMGDQEEMILGPATVIFTPHGQSHAIRATGTVPLLYLSIVAPNEDVPDETVEHASEC